MGIVEVICHLQPSEFYKGIIRFHTTSSFQLLIYHRATTVTMAGGQLLLRLNVEVTEQRAYHTQQFRMKGENTALPNE